MKKAVYFFLALTFALGTMTVSANAKTAAAEKLPGKIAIITGTISQYQDEYRSALEVVKKYGEENVIHVTWPDMFMTEQDQMESIVEKITNNPDVKVLIINQAVPGTNAAVDKLLDKRNDIFIVYCSPHEDPADVCESANLLLMQNDLKMGETIPVQAKKLGAKTLVHYSFPRHMSQHILSVRRDLMKVKCEEIGIEFIDAITADPMSDIGMPVAQQFILEDAAKMIEKYGKDTAFFTTNCGLQAPLIKSCVENGAIYPSSCDPSPYHGFPGALGIEEGDIGYTIKETTKVLAEKGVLGKISTWPLPLPSLFTYAAADYGIKWMNGEVTKGEIDRAVLLECMEAYTGPGVDMETYADSVDGKTYDNFLLVMEPYFTYGDMLPPFLPTPLLNGLKPHIPYATTDPITVVLNGKKLDFTLPIINVEGTTFYPMRELFGALGAEVNWDAENKTASGKLGEKYVEFKIDSGSYVANGENKNMTEGKTSFLYNDRTYIPIRYAAQALGLTVGWDGSTNTIIITK